MNTEEKEIVYMCVQPCDTYFVWQVHLWLESLRKLNQSDKAVVLVFTPNYRERNLKWDELVALYPESKFCFYKDEDNVTAMLGIYIPVLRPYTISRFLKEFPEYSAKAIFYCDADIIFLEGFNIEEFKDDDINYLSDTNSYLNATYFDSKIRDVLPEKLEEYKTRDILGEITSVIGISRDICEINNLNSGGAQYFLKNTDSSFWVKVMNDCILIRTYLQTVNRQFFPSEDRGFQSWVADMLAVLWNLWLRDKETKVIPEMEFAWSTDNVEKLERCTILHNAGIVSDNGNGYPAFYKGKYHQGNDPFKDVEHLDNIINNPISQKHCTHVYTTKLLEMKNKYKLNY
jgi:hypothetical protein